MELKLPIEVLEHPEIITLLTPLHRMLELPDAIKPPQLVESTVLEDPFNIDPFIPLTELLLPFAITEQEPDAELLCPLRTKEFTPEATLLQPAKIAALVLLAVLL
jgi:hypothetical protein